MAAKANAVDIRATSPALRSPSKEINSEEIEMTESQKELSLKCIKLIQGRIPNKVRPFY